LSFRFSNQGENEPYYQINISITILNYRVDDCCFLLKDAAKRAFFSFIKNIVQRFSFSVKIYVSVIIRLNSIDCHVCLSLFASHQLMKSNSHYIYHLICSSSAILLRDGYSHTKERKPYSVRITTFIHIHCYFIHITRNIMIIITHLVGAIASVSVHALSLISNQSAFIFHIIICVASLASYSVEI